MARKKASAQVDAVREQLDSGVPVQEVVVPSSPGLGHNQPNIPDHIALDLTDEEFAEYFTDLYSAIDERLQALIDADARFKLNYPLMTRPEGPPEGIEKWDDDVLARAANLREKLRAVIKTLDAMHTLDKEQILRAGKMVDGARNARLYKIGHFDSRKKLIPGADAPLNRISDRCTIYATWIEKQRRREAEEIAEAKRIEADVAAEVAAQSDDPDVLDRLSQTYAEAEEAQKVATARPAELTRVHGTGSVMSMRGRWGFVEDESDLMALVKAVAAGEADIKFLQFNAVRIGQAVRSEDLRELPGCVIREEMKV